MFALHSVFLSGCRTEKFAAAKYTRKVKTFYLIWECFFSNALDVAAFCQKDLMNLLSLFLKALQTLCKYKLGHVFAFGRLTGKVCSHTCKYVAYVSEMGRSGFKNAVDVFRRRQYCWLTLSLQRYRFSAFWLRSKCSICSYQLNI